MCRNIVDRGLKNKRAFTLVELVVSSLIATFIFLGSWSIYTMVWRWWHETLPFIEAQKVARVALESVINGWVDPTAGTDGSYARRSGISWMVYEPVVSSALSVADKIEFGLEGEKDFFADYPIPHNIRAFYLTMDALSGLKAVSYKDSNAALHQIKSTIGITDLKFEKFKDVVTNKIYIKVTATVEKDIPGTRQGSPYHIRIEYADYVFLRNF